MLDHARVVRDVDRRRRRRRRRHRRVERRRRRVWRRTAVLLVADLARVGHRTAEHPLLVAHARAPVNVEQERLEVEKEGRHAVGRRPTGTLGGGPLGMDATEIPEDIEADDLVAGEHAVRRTTEVRRAQPIWEVGREAGVRRRGRVVVREDYDEVHGRVGPFAAAHGQRDDYVRVPDHDVVGGLSGSTRYRRFDKLAVLLGEALDCGRHI